MLNFFIGFAFFEFGALCGFFVAALMQAARDGGEIAGRNRTKDIPKTTAAKAHGIVVHGQCGNARLHPIFHIE